MTIEQYKKQLIFPLRQATLVFLLKEDQILLAMKKRGFGVGRFNGVGGKVEKGETPWQSAIREVKEEIGVNISGKNEVAKLNFYFPHVDLAKNFNQQVVVYLVRNWEGEPIETEEMKPEWFQISEIPFSKMWSDDQLWLPKVLGGKKIEAEFMFNENEGIKEYFIEDK